MASIESVSAFVCPVCGKQHTPLFGFAANAPLAVMDIPVEEATRRIMISPLQCIIDNQRFFLRGRVLLPVEGFDEPFVWGVWAEVAQEDFLRIHEMWNTESTTNGLIVTGELDTDLPVYGSTMGVEVDVLAEAEARKPNFVVRDTTLAFSKEQREGITLERVQQIYVMLLHPETLPVAQ